ncbi:MAG: ZPR1 zinc finger domain-containing protein [Candidatus Thorarchaeota archaeon]|nr:ZPR1 zinc finger domain-containing protein [Candidatus Thorarchaeota archaeon]
MVYRVSLIGTAIKSKPVDMSDKEEIGIVCPSCNAANLKVRSMLYSIPFFNELVIFSMDCPSCHFTHNDVFSAEQRKPSRFTLHVNDPSLLRARVVRSGSGTIRFPEFGIDVEPGPAAESFITNVEGVLQRTMSVVETAIGFADTPEEKTKGTEILSKMESAADGEFPFTLILEDPAGVSGIIPDDMSMVEIEELSVEEASKLKGAPFWLDAIREDYSAESQ